MTECRGFLAAMGLAETAAGAPPPMRAAVKHRNAESLQVVEADSEHDSAVD